MNSLQVKSQDYQVPAGDFWFTSRAIIWTFIISYLFMRCKILIGCFLMEKNFPRAHKMCMHAQEQVQYIIKMVEWSVERMGGQYCIMVFGLWATRHYFHVVFAAVFKLSACMLSHDQLDWYRGGLTMSVSAVISMNRHFVTRAVSRG